MVQQESNTVVAATITYARETFYDTSGNSIAVSTVEVSVDNNTTHGAATDPNPTFTYVPSDIALTPFSTLTTSFSLSSSISTSSISSSSTSSSTPPTTLPSNTSSKPSSASSSSSSSPPSCTSCPSPQAGQISPIKAVGIGIGTAVIGALIAVLAVWVLFRRKRSGDAIAKKYSWTKARTHGDNEKGIRTRDEITLETNLLERADDSDIRTSMQDLNEMIDQHCVNYYHLQNVNINQCDLENRLVECGYSSPNTSGPSVAELARLLQNPKTRIAAIHRLISQLVLSHADWRSKPEVSLLPSHITNFCQSIPPVENYPGSEEVFEKSFTKWRHLSAFLLQPIRSSREALKANEQELQGAINRNIASLNDALSSFVKTDLENQRRRQDTLGAVIFAGAQIGLLLFSQPFEWRISWQPTSSRTELAGYDKARIRTMITEISGQGSKQVRNLVVFPAIGERIDSNGLIRVRVIAHCIEVEI